MNKVEVIKEEKIYQIPVTWEVYGVMEIMATSYEEAIDEVYGDAPLPEGEYIDSSISVNEEMLLSLNTPKQVALKSVTDKNCWYKDVPIGTVFNVLDVSNYLIDVDVDGESKPINFNDVLILNVK